MSEDYKPLEIEIVSEKEDSETNPERILESFMDGVVNKENLLDKLRYTFLEEKTNYLVGLQNHYAKRKSETVSNILKARIALNQTSYAENEQVVPLLQRAQKDSNEVEKRKKIVEEAFEYIFFNTFENIDDLLNKIEKESDPYFLKGYFRDHKVYLKTELDNIEEALKGNVDPERETYLLQVRDFLEWRYNNLSDLENEAISKFKAGKE